MVRAHAEAERRDVACGVFRREGEGVVADGEENVVPTAAERHSGVRSDFGRQLADFPEGLPPLSGPLVGASFPVTVAFSTAASVRDDSSPLRGTSTSFPDSQLDALLHPGFVSRMGLARLPRLTVYLQGVAHRIDRLADNVGRDRVWMAEVQQATERYVSAGGSLPLEADAPARIARARWMLEELRLSLFAQHLGADGPVSLQRITKALAEG